MKEPTAGASFGASFWAVLRADLRRELRGGGTILILCLFTLVLAVLLHFGLEVDSAAQIRIILGFYWLVLLFATNLGLNLLFRPETESSMFAYLMASPLERTGFFTGRLCSFSLWLLVTMVFGWLIFSLFFGLELQRYWAQFILAPAVALPGITSLGILVATLVRTGRKKETLFPLLLFPLLLPILLFGLRWSLLITAGNPLSVGPAPLAGLSLFWLWAGILFQDTLWTE